MAETRREFSKLLLGASAGLVMPGSLLPAPDSSLSGQKEDHTYDLLIKRGNGNRSRPEFACDL
jgi:hypothetical protein